MQLGYKPVNVLASFAKDGNPSLRLRHLCTQECLAILDIYDLDDVDDAYVCWRSKLPPEKIIHHIFSGIDSYFGTSSSTLSPSSPDFIPPSSPDCIRLSTLSPSSPDFIPTDSYIDSEGPPVATDTTTTVTWDDRPKTKVTSKTRSKTRSLPRIRIHNLILHCVIVLGTYSEERSGAMSFEISESSTKLLQPDTAAVPRLKAAIRDDALVDFLQ